MKKIILIGGALLVLTGAVVVASNVCCTTGCGNDCPVGVCKPGDKCPVPGDCCQK
jgi:hypothetical protein